MKIKRAHSKDGLPTKYLCFYCPACEKGHTITDDWGFDGNYNSPTINSSIGINMPSNPQFVPELGTCHSHIKNGMVHYCGDCTAHGMSNQSLPLPEFPEDYAFN